MQVMLEIVDRLLSKLIVAVAFVATIAASP